jgi:hypothetical protein
MKRTSRKNTDRPITELFAALGHVLADIIEHPNCPKSVALNISDFTSEMFNAAEDCDGKRAADARYALPVWMALLTEQA